MPIFTKVNAQSVAGYAAEVVGYAGLAAGVSAAAKVAGFDSNVVDMAEMVGAGAVVTAAGQKAYDALEYRGMLPAIPACGGLGDHLWANMPEMLKNPLKQVGVGLLKGGVAGVVGYEALKHLGGYVGVNIDTGLATAAATGAIAGALYQVGKGPVSLAANWAVNSVGSCLTAQPGSRQSSVSSQVRVNDSTLANPLLDGAAVQVDLEQGTRERTNSNSSKK